MKNYEQQNTNPECFSETAQRLYDALEIDPENFASSATWFFAEKSGDDISLASRLIANQVADIWTTQSFSPDPRSLRGAAMDLAVRAVKETSHPTHDNEIVIFWREVGTAIYGAQLEIVKDGVRINQRPITSDGLFHTSLSERNHFVKDFAEQI